MHFSRKYIYVQEIYWVSQLFKAKLQGLLEDVNWNNFYSKHFSCLHHFEKFQKIADISIFEKKLWFLFLVLKMFSKHNTNVVSQFYFMYQKNQFAINPNICEKSFILIKRVSNIVKYVKSFIKKYQLIKKLFNRFLANISLIKPKQKNWWEKSCSSRCHKSPPAVWPKKVGTP